MWAHPGQLWYKSIGGFWLGARCDIWGVFRVYKFMFVTYPVPMIGVVKVG